MIDCDICAFYYFDKFTGKWRCNKRNLPPEVLCPDYENKGEKAANEALAEFEKKAIEAVKKSNNEIDVVNVEFKRLRELIKEDREITDITTGHNWLIDKWVEYSELRNALAIEHDTLRYDLLFKRNWEDLNRERKNEGLAPICDFDERKDYIGNEMIDIDMKLNEVDKILDYLATRR